MNPRLAASSTLIAVLALSCQRAAVHRPSIPPFDADQHLAAWVHLWNTYDLSLVNELFLDDSRTTYLSSEREGLIRGIADIRAHHVGFGFVEGGKTPERELWVEDVASNVFGTIAVVTARWLFGDRNADPASVQQGPMTVVYVLEEEQYRIAHMHFANY